MSKVALIHDWLVSYRGGERVFEAIAELFPDADIFTLFHKKGSVGEALGQRRIQTSFLDRIPFARKAHRYFLPLMPHAAESWDLNQYDLVISSSHCVAKGVIPSPRALHICYSYTPMRYAWDRRHDYFQSPLQKLIAPLFLNYLRVWDATSSERVTSFVADSRWVAERIRRYYGREADVIYPFVDDFYLQAGSKPREERYLVASSFAPYKRIDLAIEACKRTGRRLAVVGDGQDSKRLRASGGDGIEFLGHVSNEALRDLYRSSKALLFPGEEDFGIAPLEAMAAGCPVIAYARGGLTETVLERRTGLFFHEQSVESLVAAMEKFESGAIPIRKEDCREQALRFTRSRFQREFSEHVRRVLERSGSHASLQQALFPTLDN